MSSMMELQTRRGNIQFVLRSDAKIDSDLRVKLLEELNSIDERMESMLLDGNLDALGKDN